MAGLVGSAVDLVAWVTSPFSSFYDPIKHVYVAVGKVGVAQSHSIPSQSVLERIQQTRSDLFLKYLPSAAPQVSAEYRANATQQPEPEL